MVKHEFIEAHLAVVKKLIRSGDMSGTALSQYKIFKTYQVQVGGKMDKYLSTADTHNCSTRTVITAVKNMGMKI